jgi:uncharacterized protein YaiI (UPF0178 family)
LHQPWSLPLHTVYIDADACPVKDETYRVAQRYSLKVVVAAKAPLRIPLSEAVALVVLSGFGEVDDWIASQAGPGDVVITADIPLAARCLEQGAAVLGAKGDAFTHATIGDALALRELKDYLRQSGEIVRGPSAMAPKDRSRFLSKLDELLGAIRRQYPL